MSWGELSTSPPAKETFELRPEDYHVLDRELRGMRFEWRDLGEVLKVSTVILDAIDEEYDYILVQFKQFMKCWLRTSEPRPTWQRMVDALRYLRAKDIANNLMRSFTIAPELEVDASRAEETMYKLNCTFHHILHLTLVCVKKRERDLSHFFTSITLLPIALKAQHLRWFMEHITKITRSTCPDEVFELLNTYWNCLHTSLVHYIIKNYGDEEVKAKIKEFEHDVEVFRKSTPLYIFWRVWPEMELKEVPTDTMEHIRKHRLDWPRATLQELEEFRKNGFINYALPEIALMIKRVTSVVD